VSSSRTESAWNVRHATRSLLRKRPPFDQHRSTVLDSISRYMRAFSKSETRRKTMSDIVSMLLQFYIVVAGQAKL
jgi:hypothetical protein